MTKFQAYPSIENSYNSKYIMRWMEEFPELKDELFTYSEKYDGCNINVTISKDAIRYGKRSNFLNENETFYGFQQWVKQNPEFVEFCKFFQDVIVHDSYTWILYGEFFGPGIQNRINYGKSKQVKFFDCLIINNETQEKKWMTPYRFTELRYDFQEEWKNYTKFNTSLGDYLEYYVPYPNYDVYVFIQSPEILSAYPRDIEGIVIRPYSWNKINKYGERFILKRKTEKFAEKEHKNPSNKIKEELSPEAMKAYTEVCSYINPNRVLSCFSKEGPIENIRDMGKYIKLISDDAISDFLKENSIDHFSEKEKSKILNLGHKVAPLLKQYIQNGEI